MRILAFSMTTKSWVTSMLNIVFLLQTVGESREGIKDESGADSCCH